VVHLELLHNTDDPDGYFVIGLQRYKKRELDCKKSYHRPRSCY